MSELTPEALAAYRAARDAYLAADDAADAAFLRYITRLQAGLPTNAAQASRLANEANYLAADLASAQYPLFRAEVDPADIDRADGICRDVSYG